MIDNEHIALANTVGELLQKRCLTLSVAESCTGGLIADRIVSVPGCSKYFNTAVIAYNNEAKEVFLGVKNETILTFGAVSSEVAIEMARGIRVRSNADIGISTTGIAGPTGGNDSKLPGTVWFGISTQTQEQAISLYMPLERNSFRAYASFFALDLIRKLLLDLPL